MYNVGAGDTKAGTVCSLPFDCSHNHDEKMVKVSEWCLIAYHFLSSNINVNVHFSYRLHKQCEVLLSAFVNREVSTRVSLLESWRKEPQCKNHIS